MKVTRYYTRHAASRNVIHVILGIGRIMPSGCIVLLDRWLLLSGFFLACSSSYVGGTSHTLKHRACCTPCSASFRSHSQETWHEECSSTFLSRLFTSAIVWNLQIILQLKEREKERQRPRALWRETLDNNLLVINHDESQKPKAKISTSSFSQPQ